MIPARHELAWSIGAACADQPSDAFFPGHGAYKDAHDASLRFCNDRPCPCRRQCLAYAIAGRERMGIWGGMIARDRRLLAATRCPRCDTPVGRRTVAAMIAEGRQHARCPACNAWVEVIPPWETPHRNSTITGTGRRT